ncbi:membrane fraction protein [Punctularia strigosozonata HHB-11173 SS5]|uniref:membrane fraction protein n=1 Tax=Punctularia strigosozonata (strain HHB-11173) TaxID=741275 RepID=UPI0004417A14|nr:membrane fraction protein [Punctularia strigosozonata HHB-11173 SS5]EIN14538.1 membrane fraction protein [Punctularia strigosozonata HHB-11173 SS5]
MESSGNDGAPAVPLPKHTKDTSLGSSKPPVWSLEDNPTTEAAPLQAKCARHRDDRGGVCCKELKDDDERQLVDPDVVRDAVIGLSDGLTVPFALTAGLSSLGSSKVVVLGGVAELIAGAISMGIGGFLASQAERDHYRYLHRHTAARVVRSCAGEMEREVHAVLGPVGVDEMLSRQVAECLRRVEMESRTGEGSSTGSSDEETGLRWSKDVGLSAFLLKFGEGLEEVTNRRMYTSAFTIGMGYLVGGFIPLVPYFFVSRAHIALLYSSILTGIVLLVFGAVKSRVSGAASSAKDYVWGAISTLLVGGVAAGAAYGIVAALEG